MTSFLFPSYFLVKIWQLKTQMLFFCKNAPCQLIETKQIAIFFLFSDVAITSNTVTIILSDLTELAYFFFFLNSTLCCIFPKQYALLYISGPRLWWWRWRYTVWWWWDVISSAPVTTMCFDISRTQVGHKKIVYRYWMLKKCTPTHTHKTVCDFIFPVKSKVINIFWYPHSLTFMP